MPQGKFGRAGSVGVLPQVDAIGAEPNEPGGKTDDKIPPAIDGQRAMIKAGHYRLTKE